MRRIFVFLAILGNFCQCETLVPMFVPTPEFNVYKNIEQIATELTGTRVTSEERLKISKFSKFKNFKLKYSSKLSDFCLHF